VAGAVDAAGALFLVWCFLWLCFVLVGVEAAGACAKTRPEVAAIKNDANAIAITFFIFSLLNIS
jgi:hypothetical protein